MSFSKEWDQAYSASTHLSVWPWSDVVSLVNRHCKHLLSSCDVLELGCGAGANIPFFDIAGINYHGIDGSPTAIGMLQQQYQGLADNLVCGDFVSRIPFDKQFDIVLDRAAITHNDSASVRSCIENVKDIIKPSGFFIGVDWFSTNHSDSGLGVYVDPRTRRGFADGQFKGVGNVHFADEICMRELFADFHVIYLVEKVHKQIVPRPHTFASFNLVAQKRS